MSLGRWSNGLARIWLWAYAGTLWLMLAYAMALQPVAFGDQFEEISRTYRSSLWRILGFYLSEPHVYFRPLEYLWRELLLAMFGERLFSYNLFGIMLLGLIVALFLALCPLRRGRDAVAAAIALTALLGHHAFAASMELNQVVTNLVVVALLLVALHLILGRGGRLAGAAAVLVSLSALLTKEIGIVVPLLLLGARLLGFRGPRPPAALAVLALLVLYLGFRASVVLGLGKIHDPGYGSHEGLAVYLLNGLATLLNILTSEPKGGISGFSSESLLQPWKLVQITALLASGAVIAAAARGRAIRNGGSERDVGDPAGSRLGGWLVLLAGAVLVSSALGFYHSADYFGVTSLPPLALVLYLSLRQLLADLDSPMLGQRRRLAAALLLLVTSSCWTLRLPAGFFFLRDLSANVQHDWATRYDSYAAKIAGTAYGTYLPAFRAEALGLPVADAGRQEGRLRRLFGGRDQIGR